MKSLGAANSMARMISKEYLLAREARQHWAKRMKIALENQLHSL
jgi:hypothetical protein